MGYGGTGSERHILSSTAETASAEAPLACLVLTSALLVRPGAQFLGFGTSIAPQFQVAQQSQARGIGGATCFTTMASSTIHTGWKWAFVSPGLLNACPFKGSNGSVAFTYSL